MAEVVWTKLMIGGTISPQVVRDLRPRLCEYFPDAPERIGLAVLHKAPISLEGDVNFGDVEEIENLCEEHDLAYFKWNAARPGQFDAEVRHWRPGMDEPERFRATDDGLPTLALIDIEAAAIAYGPRALDLLKERLQRASPDAMPAFDISSAAPTAPVRSLMAERSAEAPLLRSHLDRLRDLVRTYDDGLNDDGQRGGARAPTGDDYNRLFEIIMSDAAPVARQQLAPAALGKGQEQEALKVLETFVSECGGNPPDFLREVFGQAEDLVLEEARRRVSTPAVAKLPASTIEPAAALEQILGALRLAAPVAEDAIADIYLEGVPLDPTKEAEQRSNLEGAERALEAVRQAVAVAVPLLERFQKEAAASAATLAAEPPMEVYESTARLNGWRHAGHHWWNSQDYPSWDEAQAHGVLYRDARELCEAEDLDPEVGKGAVLSENCTFITDRHGDLRPWAMDGRAEVVESLRAHLNGENIRVAVKDGQVGLLIEEAFAFTAIPLQATVGAELTAVRSRFPEAEIWLTQGAHVVEDQDVAARAFVPADKVTAERIGELNDALYDLVAEGAGSTFTLSASPSM